ncbi:MAG: VWA domain-containing protein [Candidatus Thorarchaeota archaeon]|nr:VWA domain-containing protein [Candidatus Thorarchaeota archaeon]
MTRESRTILVTTVIVLLCSAFIPMHAWADPFAEDALVPADVSASGSITDNFVNITYQMVFDNTGSSIAQEVNWFFGLQDSIRLSNLSVILGNKTYWGRVLPEVEAVEVYNESVALNKSAVLVQRYADGYSVRMNVENGTEAILSVFIEGLLTRSVGLYSLDLPLGRTGIIDVAFTLDIDIISNFAPVTGYSIKGLPSFIATDLPNGIQLEHTSSSLTIAEGLEITYALDRQTGGAQLLTHTNGSDQFFVYMLAPEVTEVVETAHRQYVFVLDKSGSMGGLKIEQAKTAFNSMIGTLLSQDLFNVVAFDDEISILWDEPHSASASNIDEAQDWVQSISAGGSTNFHGASITGLATFNPGDNVKAMLILSDGLPTAGTIQDTPGILSAISEANTLDVSISTVAFGSDSDETLMANIAAQNDGYFVFIEPSEDASTELLDFYGVFSTPIADDYSIVFDGAIEVISLSPLDESPFFNGTEVIVAGRYIEGMTVTTSIDYVTGTETYVDTVGVATQDKPHVEHIWAQQRVSYLLRQASLHGENDTLRNEIVQLGMYYGIAIAGYTAMVLTAYDASSAGEGTLDGFYGYVPTTTTGSPAQLPADFLIGSTMLVPILLIGIGLVVSVILISKFRKC